MKALMTALACFGFVGAVFAGRTNTVVNGATDWTVNTSYADQSFVPGEGDTVCLPSGFEVYVNSQAQNDYISRFERILPADASSRIVLTVPETEVWDFKCAVTRINLSKVAESDFMSGEVVKRGTGTLQVCGGNKVANTASSYDCGSALTVEAGLVQVNSSINNLYFGYLSVSNDAVFQAGVGDQCLVRGLFGDGLITNNVNATKTATIQLCGNSTYCRRSLFSGRICGSLSFRQNGTAGVALTGSENKFVSTLRIDVGNVEAASIGLKGGASSVGTNDRIVFKATTKSARAQLTYAGSGDESSDRILSVSQAAASCPAALSGGHHGGLTFAGSIVPDSSEDVQTSRSFVFTGSNQVECVMDGTLEGCETDAVTCLYPSKEGSGAWRFTQHNGRLFPSGFAIREGVLRFDSLHERGQLSSLGTATNLTDGSGAVFTPQVPYAFTLGTTEDGTSDAVFEYTGTNSVLCSTRPIALAGDGHFRNDTARRVRFAGVSSLAAGKALKTFVLDGSGQNTNEVADVTDGAGRTGVTKAGTGTWVLSGDQTFTGPLKVESGKLIVRKTLPGRYTWFRWTIKNKWTSTGSYGEVLSVSSFMLMDEDGYFQSTNLVENGYCSELEPGEFGFQTDYRYVTKSDASQDGLPYRLFIWQNRNNNYGFNARFYPPRSTAVTAQALARPDTWLPIVMRLPEGSAEVKSFDYMNVFAEANQRSVVRSSLEGSVDGLHWNMLTNDITAAVVTDNSWQWSMKGTRESTKVNFANPHTGGAPVSGSTEKTYSVLEDVESVSVAPGAELIADGDVTISRLVVDASGAGTFDGFAFAENGTIAFTNVPKGAVTIPATFANVKDQTLKNVAMWDFTIDGKVRHYTMSISESGFELKPSGIVLIVR